MNGLIVAVALLGVVVGAFLVPESAPIGQLIGYISGKPEISSQPRYFVVFPDEQTAKFIKVDETSGEITTISALDFEKRSRFEFLAVPVHAVDGIQIVVDVDDENDNSPKFSDESIFLGISEYAHIGSEFALPLAIDGDGHKYNVHKYRIAQGNVNNVFKISTRILHEVLYADLVVNGQLDREYRDKYELLVEAVDGGTPPKIGQLRVSIKILDANDNPPMFSQSRYLVTVPANTSIGSSITTLKATDADSEQNAQITYHLKKANSPSNAFFSISPSSGVLKTTGHLLPASTHDVVVVASDAGSPSLQASAVVSVVVQGSLIAPPAVDIIWLTETATAHLPESISLGSIVARISLNEEHKDCQVKLSGCPSLCLQQTDASHVYLLLVCGGFDRETNAEFHLKFLLVRKGDLVLEHPLLLTIGDVNDNWPHWNSAHVHVSMNRTLGGGRTLTATDPDLGQNGWIRYSILDTNMIGIDSDTGRLFIVKELDCSIGPEIKFRVRAEDGGVPPLFSDLQVTADLVNSQSRPPSFVKALYELEIAEDTPVGTCLVKVVANNAQCEGSRRVRYSIPDSEMLSVDSVSGTICVRKTFDFERQPSYQTNVIATNSNGDSTTSLVSVRVTDMNDNAPVFYPQVYNISIREGPPRSTALLVLSANDRDTGLFGAVRFSLISDSSTFYVNVTSGELFSKASLSRGKYHLIVSAVDGGGLHAETPAHVHIVVIAGDALAPVFTQSKYEVRTTEDILPGIVIGSVAAVAPGVVRYSIYSGDPERRFSIQEDTGKISVTRYLDADQSDTVILNIQADLEGGGSNQTQVVVYIDDHNDNAPKFASSLVEITVREDQSVGEPFYVVHAADADRKKNGEVRYTLISSHPLGPIDLQPTTGQLLLTAPFDYEQIRDYKVRIKAQDEGVPPKSSNMTVIVHVSDVNDNAPVFEKSEYKIEVVENAAAKVEVARIVARDIDSNENGQVLYRVANGSEYFGIDEKMGVLYTKRALDREVIANINVTVTAEDRGAPSLSTSVLVRVAVLDMNDNAPSCQSTSTLVILANSDPSAVVGTIVAVDVDQGINGSVVYRSQTQHPIFVVKANGYVQLRRALKDSDATDFRLSVIASDQGVPQKSSVCQVAVKVSKGESDVVLVEPFSRSVSLPGKCVAACRLGSFNATSVHKWQIQSSELSNYFAIRDGVLSLISMPPQRPPYLLTLVLSDTQGRQTHIPIRVQASKTNNQQEPIKLNTAMPIGTRIGAVGETSRDGDFFYKSLNETCPFELDESTGSLFLADKLALANSFVCFFARINTSDSHVKELSVDFETSSAKIDRPVFARLQKRIVVREDVAPGTVVVTLNASTFDSEMPVSYRLREESRYLAVDQFTGDVSVIDALHWHETPYLTVVIEAFVSPSQATSMVLFVAVDDVNDHAPRFISASEMFVAESERRGVVHRVVVVDDDDGESAAISFRISAEDSAKFGINENTGEISVVDATNLPSFVVVQATDHGDPPKSAEQQILVKTSNESRRRWQYFDDDTYHIDVSQSVREDSVILSLDSSLPLRLFPTNPNFRLRGSNVVVATTSLLAQVYKFTVVAESEKGDIDSATMMINVKSALPQGPKISSTSCGLVTIEENKEMKAFKKIHVVDATQNATFRIQGTPPKFSLNSTTAELSCVELDRETSQEHLLVIVVDDGGRNDSCTVRVVVSDVNDNQPQFASNTPQTVFINDSNNSVIYKFSASDMDISLNGKISFELAEDESRSLDVSPESGELILRRNTLKGTLKVWMIRVRVFDHGSPSLSNDRFVRIVDQRRSSPRNSETQPAFLRQTYVTSVDEGLSRGQLVAKVETTQRNAPVTYSIVEGNVDSAFVVDADGVIRTAQELDREIVDLYSLKVIGTGAWTGSISTIVNVRVNNVNDNPPSFPPPRQRKISENQPVGSYVATASANDVDGLSPLQYFISNTQSLFRIDQFTGVVHLEAPLDFESAKEHLLRINVTDGMFNVATTLTIIVVDVNDNAPTFSKNFFDLKVPNLLTTSNEDTLLAKIQASDLDSGQNSRLTYSLLSDSVHNFRISSDDGSLFLTSPLPSKSSQIITVVAVDDGMPHLTSTVPVRVTVVDEVRDRRPTFVNAEFEFNVSEDASVSTVIGNVSNDHHFLVYRVLDVEASRYFSVDRLGRISVASPLDREERDFFSFLVEVDSEVPTAARPNGDDASTARVNIRLLDVNDNAPTFAVVPSVVLRDGLTSGEIIATLTATDRDSDENGRVAYSILTGDDYGILSLGAESGALVFNEWNDAQLADHPNGSWTIVVEARDHGQPIRVTSITIAVILNLSSWSGTAPFFVLPTVNVHVLEDTSPNGVVSRVRASNRFGLPNRGLMYSLKDDDGNFGIDSVTGEVRLKKSLDWESSTFFGLFVSVSDGNGRSAVVPLKIFVEPVDEYAPTFLKTAYKFQVSTMTPVGEVVGDVRAIDEDGGFHGVVRYHIQDFQSTFAIQRDSGVITLQKNVQKRKNLTVEQITVIAESSTKRSFTAVTFEFGNFEEIGRLPRILQLKVVQLTAFFLVFLLVLLISSLSFCILCNKRKFEQKPPKKEVFSVMTCDHPMKKALQSKASNKTSSLASSSSMNFSASRRVDPLSSTRSHVDSGIDPDTVSANSSVTDYLVSIGVNPNPIPSRIKPNTTYDSLNNSALNEYIYACVDDVVPPGPMNLSRSIDVFDVHPPITTHRAPMVPKFQPLTEIFSEIAELQKKERDRQYVQVEI